MFQSRVSRALVALALTVPLAMVLVASRYAPASLTAERAPQAKAAASAADPQEEPPPSAALPICVRGFSKNLCNGTLVGGTWQTLDCQVAGGIWTTMFGSGATLKVAVLNNPDTCGGAVEVPCDEAFDLNGTLDAKLDFRIRLNDPCPVRGCWDGEDVNWTLVSSGGVALASGDMNGTLGVGTHRVPVNCLPPPAPARCGDDCETCHMAQFDATSDPPRWIIHMEGCMRGTVLSGVHAGCTICVTLQGFFVAPADADGRPAPPITAVNAWSFCGTADGVLECACPTP